MKFSVLLLLAASMATAGGFEAHFLDKTMRLDYHHLGTATVDQIAVDRIVSDGPWPGSKQRLIDELRFGSYLCEVYDEAKREVLFSYGFATIFSEWQTTEEASKNWGSFHESLRFPWPKHKVVVVLSKRGADNQFAPFWELLVDPAARHINPVDRVSEYPVHQLKVNGPAERKVDLLMLGDGYTAAEMDKFHADAKRLSDALFLEEPYKSRQGDFNLYVIDTPSAESGISRPHENVYKRSALGSSYSSFDSQRYVLNLDNRRLREIAAAVPYDYLVILVNDKTYGGGGIFRWQATAAASNSVADYLFVHEFGHHFAALADEYYTSSIAYTLSENITVEPWEPNLTALLPGVKLKWADLVAEGTPLPTPWAKEEFEKRSVAAQAERQRLRDAQAAEEKLDELFESQRVFETKLLGELPYSRKVGAFEGGGYRQKGYYRPETDCLMFTRDRVGFCAVCRRAIEAVIDHYTH